MSQFSLQSINERKESTPLWHKHDQLANKTGPTASVYYVKPISDLKQDISSYNIHNSDYKINAIKDKNHTVHTIYQGEWFQNMKSGQGIQLFVNNKNQLMRYIGEWSQNVRNGIGELYKSNKIIDSTSKQQLDKYAVEWRLVYSGEYYSDMKHGHGIYYYKNGDVYTGEWCEDQRSGQGELVYKATQNKYIGAWSNNTMNGIGTSYYATNDIYRGEYVNGIKNGSGVHYYASKNKLYIGEWINDIAKCGSYISIVDFIDSICINNVVQAEYITDNNIDISDLLPTIKQAVEKVKQTSIDIADKIPRLRLANADNVISDSIEAMQSDAV